jgi:carnitine-CoA ligase
MRNLARLLVDTAAKHPQARFGMVDDPWELQRVADTASQAARWLAGAGVASGTRVALIGETSNSYLLTWAALQLAGAEAALVNPAYPAPLLRDILAQLSPTTVLWVGSDADRSVAPAAGHVDATGLAAGHFIVDGRLEMIIDTGQGGDLPGLDRKPLDVAGYMHTSGTTGTPKLCVQSHEYFLRLGRFFADALCISHVDTVLAPLPMFHINPLGYGVIGGLTAGASVLGMSRFSASGFWPVVKQTSSTILVLHAPPAEILKRATTGADAAGHHVRVVFLTDGEFLRMFDIPLAISAYGSTEAGGLSHVWAWRQSDEMCEPEGMSRYGGRARHDVEWRVAEDGEIMLRPLRPGVMFDGYLLDGETTSPFSADGWFATGDVGRVTEDGNLIFIERRSESIRVKGEFVPIGFVEREFARIDGITDLALWRRSSELVDDELLLYIVAPDIPFDEIRTVMDSLPRFMRPSRIVRLASLPRDTGAGKVRRRELASAPMIEEHLV